MSRALKRWQQYFKAVPQDAVLTESDFRSLKKLLGSCPKAKDTDFDAWNDLLDTINEFVINNPTGITITPEHHKKGEEWLRKSISYIRWHMKKYQPAWLGEFEAAAKGVKKFYFGGFQDITSNFVRCHYADRRELRPIWRVELPDGRKFRYAYSSWQSNSGLEANPDHYV